MKTNIIVFIIIASLTYAATVYFETRTPANINSVPLSPIENMNVQIAPDFTFTTATGTPHKLYNFKGKTIALNFWASWCPPCIKELPVLLQAAEEQDIILIALSSDLDEASMNRFLKKNDMAAPRKNVFFAWDESQIITQKTFQTFKLPETILIDEDMNMRQKIIGADWEYEDLIEKLNTIKADAAH